MSARRTYEVGSSRLVLDAGSVLSANAEVVVSSDDYMLSMGGGVSAAIASAAGTALVLDAAKAVPARAGDVVVTTAGALQARYVFHVVTIGPEHWRAPPDESATLALVREATRRCLHLADTLGMRSLAFPALGTGAAGFTVEASAAAMAEVVAAVLTESPTAFDVSIMLLGRTLASPMQYLAFYEEFARRVPLVAARKVSNEVARPSPVHTSGALSTLAELELERQNLERRLVDLRRDQGSSEAEHKVRRAIERNTDARLAATQSERTTRTAPVTVFVSYAREDDELRKRMYDHLGGLRAAGEVKEWYDGEIVAGAEWAAEIRDRMAAAEVILLLITPAFLGSDFIRRVELASALERHRQQTARVIPIIMKSAYWQGTQLSVLQALPQHAKAVMTWTDPDAAMADIARGVDRAIKDVRASRTT